MSNEDLTLYPKSMDNWSSGIDNCNDIAWLQEKIRTSLKKPGLQVAAQIIIADEVNNEVEVINVLRARGESTHIHGQTIQFDNSRDTHTLRGELNKHLGCSLEYKNVSETDPAIGYEFWQGWSQFTHKVATLIPKEVKNGYYSPIQSDSESVDTTN